MSRRKRLERMNDRLAGQAAKWQMAAISARWQVRDDAIALSQLGRDLEQMQHDLSDMHAQATATDALVEKRNQRIAELEAIVATYQQNPVWVPSPGPWETGTMPLAETQEQRCDRLIEALRTGDATCNVSTEEEHDAR
jgi:hypothetical protein